MSIRIFLDIEFDVITSEARTPTCFEILLALLDVSRDHEKFSLDFLPMNSVGSHGMRSAVE
jgi:hypothetical protein